jgi:alpha-L-fucosidase 2
MARAVVKATALCVLTVAFCVCLTTRGDESARAAKRERSRMVLWYQRPAQGWTEALPIGNGRLGGMVFGGTESERIQLNEDTIWAGERRDRTNPQSLKSLPKVRQLLFDGRPAEAEALAEKTMMAFPKRMPPYQPLGDLRFVFPDHEAYSDYVRELDLDTGIARLSYRLGDAVYRREVFASAVDQILVVRLSCDRPGRVSFSMSLHRDQDGRAETVAPDRVMLHGEAIARDVARHKDEGKVGVKFASVVRAVPEGGRVQTAGDHLEVRDADAATVLVAAATDFRSQDPRTTCERTLSATDQPYEQLRSRHVRDYQALFQRVELELVGPAEGGDASDRPTDGSPARASP